MTPPPGSPPRLSQEDQALPYAALEISSPSSKTSPPHTVLGLVCPPTRQSTWGRRVLGGKEKEGGKEKPQGAPEEKFSNIKRDMELRQARMESVPLVLNQEENRTGPSDLAPPGVSDLGRKQHIPRVQICEDFLLGVTSGST